MQVKFHPYALAFFINYLIVYLNSSPMFNHYRIRNYYFFRNLGSNLRHRHHMTFLYFLSYCCSHNHVLYFFCCYRSHNHVPCFFCCYRSHNRNLCFLSYCHNRNLYLLYSYCHTCSNCSCHSYCIRHRTITKIK